ncbi:MAG: DUF4845 domain-containing protein [Sideroxydans sp.]|nr:DUF4845 domain-containing protein [Sideroxydans sp.]
MNKSKQTGFSFGNFLIILVLLVFGAMFGFKLIPAYMENGKVQNMLEAISHDPDMQTASIAELRSSFDKRASVNWVTTVKGADLVIEKGQDGRPVLSTSNEVRIKLMGNMTLLLEFNPSSSGK